MDAGLVALGDSITYGEGGIVQGVDGRSWALWLARAMDVPYTNYAVCGAVCGDVAREQLPRVRRDDYGLAVLYAGVNDVRGLRFDLFAFDRFLDETLAGLAAKASRLAVCTLPLDLGRPRAGAKVAAANGAIRAAAARHGATVVLLDDLAGWRLMLPDSVHPTALGQLEIADRAAQALGVTPLPSSLLDVDGAPGAVARTARTWAREWVRDMRRRRRRR